MAPTGAKPGSREICSPVSKNSSNPEKYLHVVFNKIILVLSGQSIKATSAVIFSGGLSQRRPRNPQQSGIPPKVCRPNPDEGPERAILDETSKPHRVVGRLAVGKQPQQDLNSGIQVAKV